MPELASPRSSLLAVALLAAACRDAAPTLGRTPAEARRHAEDLLLAVTGRFGPVEIEPSFAAVRPKLARAAPAPSRVFGDPELWTFSAGQERLVAFGGERSGGRYRIGVRPGAPTPRRPGEYRSLLRLRDLGRSDYEWSLRDELALGEVAAAELADTLTAAFLDLERGSEAEARALALRTLPRSAAAMGRLFSLDALGLARMPEGATSVTLAASLHPRAIARDFPRYAAYLEKYGGPVRFRATAYDESGAAFWDVSGAERRYTLRVALHGGSLAPLAGPPRGIPARLCVLAQFHTRSGIFGFGVRNLEADVALLREPHEKAFSARFREEPDWEMPWPVKPLLRASLRRPFEGEGASMRLEVRDAPGEQTLVVADYGGVVRESWIVRLLGGFVSTAVDEFRQGAEQEADRFAGEALRAFEADVLALLARAE